ncbi:nucleotidyltransferase family protein [Streptomyces genisteinicus]|uniref:Nucleotidyltransferase family protein n=1 Tax=Streptomyces genisteinicus TaxID=2768068 RepID=A0A7H0I087_9ACTN|nr:nucleotidyltransferase family protein [Streptomyces genisteinicus]QNP66203.1 nucleotidyltransferase family protein [Streptomyces genisteinicus]
MDNANDPAGDGDASGLRLAREPRAEAARGEQAAARAPGAEGAAETAPQAGPPVDRHQAILEAAKQVGSLLKREGHAFALAGSVAVYAHGGAARFQHDADFCVRREDADAVAATLREGGVTVYEPPEDWLWKAKCLGEDVDLLFEIAHEPVTSELLDRAVELPVDSVRMPVLSATDLLRSLLGSFSEHHCDFGAVLPIARALREKVDWELVRRDRGDSPMPAAFLYLLERLQVVAPQADREGTRPVTGAPGKDGHE